MWSSDTNEHLTHYEACCPHLPGPVECCILTGAENMVAPHTYLSILSSELIINLLYLRMLHPSFTVKSQVPVSQATEKTANIMMLVTAKEAT